MTTASAWVHPEDLVAAGAALRAWVMVAAVRGTDRPMNAVGLMRTPRSRLEVG